MDVQCFPDAIVLMFTPVSCSGLGGDVHVPYSKMLNGPALEHL